MASKVKLNSSGMAAMLKSAEVRAGLQGPAEAVLAAAKGGAPVATGAYRDSLHLVNDTTDRAVVRVVVGVDYGMLVEADTGNLARALGSA